MRLWIQGDDIPGRAKSHEMYVLESYNSWDLVYPGLPKDQTTILFQRYPLFHEKTLCVLIAKAGVM